MHRVGYRKAWQVLGRLEFGVILLAALLRATLLGTVFPQARQQADMDAWWQVVRARYGLLYGPLRTLGLFDLFGALWFKALVGLLMLSTLACLSNRVWPLGAVVFRPRTRLPRERFERAPWREIIHFSSASDAQSVLSSVMQRRHFRVQTETQVPRTESVQAQVYVRGDCHRLPRLGTLLTHIGLLCLLLGAASSALWAWRAPELAVNSEGLTHVANDTRVALHCTEFAIDRYDDGTPRDFRAAITVLSSDGQVLTQGTIRLNDPLTHGGVSYYLQSYHLPQVTAGTDSRAPECSVVLNAVYDPGFGFVIAAGLCLVAGTALTFHFPHRRVWARIDEAGETILIGSTGWDKERFGRQFDALAAELRAEAELRDGIDTTIDDS